MGKYIVRWKTSDGNEWERIWNFWYHAVKDYFILKDVGQKPRVVIEVPLMPMFGRSGVTKQ